ncbi:MULTISPECIES: hypothetical protein [Thermoanaerobacterium]|uniref:Uncharacterized protein n=3 Tax=Thermoanaerobacterium TaxID=28895 RepID=L0IR37_THETR|nr:MULTISPECIES: hypothetical protein [Thermoanaerobacterium]AFK94267.1 hypothetical protein Tsac_2720 [Thermoanaerobacterium saccharolyticum JW/SL-YS485]AGB20442.1 hypothetical protein Thethe_02895 [Thermoanaerobacterium thermosaccharolyticum M0795]ETO39060.1 hypothetical protein V518_0767 [Thermoanaerobacterium aotearoense SCUT27]
MKINIEKKKFLQNLISVNKIPENKLKNMRIIQSILEAVDYGNTNYINFDEFTLEDIRKVSEIIYDTEMLQENEIINNAIKTARAVYTFDQIKGKTYSLDEDFF